MKHMEKVSMRDRVVWVVDVGPAITLVLVLATIVLFRLTGCA